MNELINFKFQAYVLEQSVNEYLLRFYIKYYGVFYFVEKKYHLCSMASYQKPATLNSLRCFITHHMKNSYFIVFKL